MGEVKPVKMDNWTPSDSATVFADGERVLCFHGPLIYEAKVLKTKPETTPVEYYIHYAGWSKNWDEWVPESRVLKYNDENVKRQKEVSRQYGERSKKDNKKGNAKAKKMEQVGNESRASTPSKDGNTSLPHKESANSSSSATSTPVSAATTPATSTTKNDSSSNNNSSSNTTTTTTTTTTTSRSNRKSTQAATRPGTPNADNNRKEDAPAATTAADSSKQEEEEPSAAPAAPKTKRMSSHSSSSSDQQRTTASTASNGGDVSVTTTTTSQQQATTAASAASAATEAPCVESEETYTAKLEVKIKIPDELKHYLTDDWYAVVREHKLLELPAKVTVQQITEQYLAHKKSVKSTNASKEVAINDVLDGIIEYFNVMLGSQLLYKFERTQYADIMQKHPDTPLSEMYGSFHLLRLFVRLGSMLSYSALDQPAMQTLLSHLHDFLKFLVKNSAMYFSMSNFINVDPEYVRNAQ
ncbi:nuA4 complex subunit EAF3 homolog [Drosophila albomicans]|uniref:NuA4 complex subunit EAF3 homolog n=1 Tax=Drosophila albomicans TaxID=7291 RepID=A0A9C6T2V0_DROAB|nr:nuA4 complex subunit EAF3 homolog [Drosophila albomicans]